MLTALVGLADQALGLLPEPGGEPMTLQRILGYVMAPLVWPMGILWQEAMTAGALMGTKTILNGLLPTLAWQNFPPAR